MRRISRQESSHVTLEFIMNFLRCDLKVPIFLLQEIECSRVFHRATPVVLMNRVACWVTFLGGLRLVAFLVLCK